MVKVSADSLLMVINDILDFSKIEAGKLELDDVEFELRDVVADALKALALRAHEKGLELGYRIAPGVPRSLVGDSLRLRQILAQPGRQRHQVHRQGRGVRRRSTAGRAGGSGACELHFPVRDTGMGIPKDKQQIIFEAFAQADGSTTRKYDGTGLGLTISSRLVEMMGGELWVESEAGEGSTFHFTARLQRRGRRSKAEPSVPGHGARPRGVLVVDDNRTSGGILGELLRGWGLRPDAGRSSGPSGSRRSRGAEAAGAPFDLMLIDAAMPRHGRLRAGPALQRARARARADGDDADHRRPARRPRRTTASCASPPTSPSRSRSGDLLDGHAAGAAAPAAPTPAATPIAGARTPPARGSRCGCCWPRTTSSTRG